jgi:hypothetical protein
MANPTTRTELKNYCLRRLGYPVLDINVDEDQLQDRIDDALEYYRDYHYDGADYYGAGRYLHRYGQLDGHRRTERR